MGYGKFCSSPADIPTGEHWAIIEGSSVHVLEEGVWAPGHGYEAHDEKFITYEAFLHKAEFEVEFKKRLTTGAYSRPTRGIHVLGTIAPKTTVELEETKKHA